MDGPILSNQPPLAIGTPVQLATNRNALQSKMKAKYGQWKRDTMQRVRRFWYVFAGVILALSLLLGFRVSGLLLSSHPSGPTRPRSSAPLGTTPPHPEASTQVQLTQ